MLDFRICGNTIQNSENFDKPKMTRHSAFDTGLVDFEWIESPAAIRSRQRRLFLQMVCSLSGSEVVALNEREVVRAVKLVLEDIWNALAHTYRREEMLEEMRCEWLVEEYV